jgi:hypothetical protein
MTAPKTKNEVKNEKEHGVQLIVFAPANADPADELQKIYMVCPSALRVVEVVEKYGDDAEDYLVGLARKKDKSALSPKTFLEDISDAVEDDGTLVSDDDFESLNGVDIQGLNEAAKDEMSDGLEEDIVAFANGSLGDIFPDDGTDGSSKKVKHDMASALDILDGEDNDDDLNEVVGGLSGNDGLDALPEL